MKFLFLQQCKSISTKVEFCWEVEQRVMWKIVDLTFLWALNFLGCQTTLVFVRTLPRIDSTSGTSTTSHLRKSAKYHLLQENIYQFEKWKKSIFCHNHFVILLKQDSRYYEWCEIFFLKDFYLLLFLPLPFQVIFLLIDLRSRFLLDFKGSAAAKSDVRYGTSRHDDE